jgi:hypothetical protein
LANVIQAVLTNGGRAALAKSFGGPSGPFQWSYGKYFKIGTAMHQSVSGQDQPIPPNAAFTDIQSVSGTSGVFWYRKTFQSPDIFFINPGTIQFRCFLDLPDANGDSFIEPNTAVNVDGPKLSSPTFVSPPIFFEIGVFDANDVMIAYGTFPAETKLNAKALNSLVNVNF